MAAEVTARLRFDTQHFRKAVENADNSWRGFSGRAQKSLAPLTKGVGAMVRGITAVGVAAAAAATGVSAMIAAGLKSGFDINRQMENVRVTIQAFTKDASVTKQIMNDLRKEAATSPFETTEILEAGKALISSAKGSREELMKLIKTSQILAALNPAQGFEGAAYALREATGGDYVSLMSRFDMSRTMINELRKQGKEGIDLVDAALKQMGAGPELIEGLANSFDGLMGRVKSFFSEIKETAALPMFETVKQETASFLKYLNGGARDGILQFAQAFGENFGESVRNVFSTIKTIDWPSVAKGAEAIANAFLKAAEGAAAAFASMPKTLAPVRNFFDRLEAQAQKGNAWINRRHGDWLGFTGRHDMAAEQYTQADANMAEADRRMDMIRRRNAAVTAADTEYQRQISENQAPLRTDEVLQNWLSTRGKTMADVQNDPALRQEVWSRFGYGGMGYDDPVSAGHNSNQMMTQTLRQSGRIPQPQQVQVTLTEQNPMHNVMAT